GGAVAGNDERGGGLPRQALHFEVDVGDDAIGAARSDEELLEIEPDIVLAERPAEIKERSSLVGQHDLQAEHAAANIAIAYEAGTARVGRDHAADRGIGAEVDRICETVPRQL